MNAKNWQELLSQMSVVELEQEKFNLENKLNQMIMLDPDELEKLAIISGMLERKNING